MKRYNKKMFLLTLLFMLCTVGQHALAALVPASVPQFQMRFRVTSVANQQPAATTFVLGGVPGMSAQSVGSQWSNWTTFGAVQVAQVLKQYPNTYSKQFPVVIKLQLSNVQPTTMVSAEIKLTQTGVTIPLQAQLNGPTLGVLVWRDAGNNPMAGTMADFNRLTIWNTLPTNPAGPRPQQFPVVDRFIGGSSDAIEWSEGIGHLAQYGLNAMFLPPTTLMRSMLLQTGVSHTGGAVYSPPGYTFAFPYLHYNMRKLPGAAGKSDDQILTQWAQSLAQPFVAAGYAPRDVALYNMADEPGWYYPDAINALRGDAAGMARFHQYLQAQGLQLADVGATSWATVQPIGVSQATTPAARRLFYWTMQFFPWDSANYFAASTQAMNQAFYPGIPNPVNWNMFTGRSYVPGPVDNNHNPGSPDAAMGAQDWFEFAQLHGSNMLWTEDWFRDNQAYKWSYYAAKLGPAARNAGISWGGYVVPRSSGQTPDGFTQKVLSIVGNGGKALEYFVFGPEYNFPRNTYSQRADVILPKMAQVHGMIAKAEDLLWPGQKPQAQVAILQPRSSEVWDPNGVSGAGDSNFNSQTVDYMAEVYDLYRSLQQQDIPAEFVPEDGLTPAGLKGYKVLYVTEPDFPAEYLPALLQWVNDGGTLVTVSGALTADRYDNPMATFQQARGIIEAQRSRLKIDAAGHLPVTSVIGGNWRIYGVKGAIGKYQGNVVASFQDGTPAIIERLSGQGAFIHYAFLPGISAYESHDYASGQFAPAALKWVAFPIQQAGVQAPVSVDQLNVETPMLLSSGGAAVTMLNWRGQDVSNLNVTAHVPFPVRSVSSVTAGNIAFKQTGDAVSFSMPLQGADVVTLRK